MTHQQPTTSCAASGAVEQTGPATHFIAGVQGAELAQTGPAKVDGGARGP